MLGLLDTLLLQPLMAIYSGLFDDALAWIEPGPRLIVFSVLLNLLLVPVYSQMERRSRDIRAVNGVVAKEVARMKRHFRGRERYFYIRAVHRQYGYNPLSHLFGSSDLFVQVLVFATVYRFLSGVGGLTGQSFGPILDLSKADNLLFGVNVLPVVMTLINAASVFAYVADRAKRMQALALAAIFLVLLYTSPAALVIYWTTNNAFSLARNIITARFATRITPQMKESARQLLAQR